MSKVLKILRTLKIKAEEKVFKLMLVKDKGTEKPGEGTDTVKKLQFTDAQMNLFW